MACRRKIRGFVVRGRPISTIWRLLWTAANLYLEPPSVEPMSNICSRASQPGPLHDIRPPALLFRLMRRVLPWSCKTGSP